MKMCYARKMRLLLAILGFLFSSSFVFAEGGGEKFTEGVNYLPINPPLVVNYGAGTGKVKYIKANISLRVEDMHAAEEVSHHMPLIRDTLIILLSSLNDEQLSNGDGKEEMRVEALAKINEALEAQINGDEIGHGKKSGHEDENAKDDHPKSKRAKNKSAMNGPVSDLLFDNLVVQK